MKVSLETLEDQLYLGHIHGPCSYLPDRDSSLLFLDGRYVGVMYRLLLDNGYRRHGLHVYRPDCSDCLECHILRIDVNDFHLSRNQKRVRRRGSEVFQHTVASPSCTPEKLALYNRYLEFQHDRTGNERINERQYREFFVDSFLGHNTFELQLYHAGRLVGVAILDQVAEALSAVYFYFDPEMARYSPGTYAILLEIEMAQQRGLRFFYPGYYIPQCAAMNYKARFRPAQWRRVGEGDWQSLPSSGCSFS